MARSLQRLYVVVPAFAEGSAELSGDHHGVAVGRGDVPHVMYAQRVYACRLPDIRNAIVLCQFHFGARTFAATRRKIAQLPEAVAPEGVSLASSRKG